MSKGAPTRSPVTLVAAPVILVVAIVAALQGSEKRVYTTYWDDLGKVYTACAGVTGPGVIHGKTYTDAQCDAMESAYVSRMLRNMGQCVRRELPFDVAKAFGHFAYNVGTANFCASTGAKLLNAGDFKGACKQILRWTFIKGKDCRDPRNKCGGIPKRREWEYQTCMQGAGNV